MQKLTKHFSAIAGRVLLIGFTMQIVLGLVWTGINIGCMEEPGVLLQLVLLSVAFGAGLFLVKTITETKKIVWMVWGSLAMLTVPMSLQCHLMNPKESIIGSFLVFQLSFLWRAIRNGNTESCCSLAKVAIFWLLEAVVAPEYVPVGAVPVILLFLYGLRKKKIGYHILLICAFGGMIFGMNSLKQEMPTWMASENFEQEKTQDTGMIYEISADLFGRCTWTTIFRDSVYWTDEMYATAGEEILISTSLYADNMNELFKPAVLQNLGEEGATGFYQELTISAVKEFPVQIMKECLWDAFAYSVPPLGTYLFLDGEGYDSYCPVNFELMRRQAPRLTGYYM